MHKDPIHSLFIASKQLKLPSCHSTNQVASDLLADNNGEEGTVVVADFQTAGRGQRGNAWEAQAGKNLILSVILRPNFLSTSNQFDLTVIASLALVKTLKSVEISAPKIKWPNDIYYKESKIAGVLIENTLRSNRLESAVIGIGLNVNQMVFDTNGAVSIRHILHRELNLDDVLQQLLVHLEYYYFQLKASNRGTLRAAYLENMMWLHQERNFKNTGTDKIFQGVIQGITDEGKLIIATNSLEHIFDFKEIAFIE